MKFPIRQKKQKNLIKFYDIIQNNPTSPSFKYLCNLMQICFSGDMSLRKKSEIKIKYLNS